ncbi:hypothetical protein NPIL_150901 [Nephila pilipes]|uniref:Uncharacterized protein n=1 Tax=Nephila pilipes TaxID=299642 RepID=A0A8X6QTD1_NEPPI|nr:hypothetical protein NPIL_150901 [Nephila pilipes]
MHSNQGERGMEFPLPRAPLGSWPRPRGLFTCSEKDKNFHLEEEDVVLGGLHRGKTGSRIRSLITFLMTNEMEEKKRRKNFAKIGFIYN